MLNKSAIKYYLLSIPTLFSNFNWWIFPFLLIKKSILIRIKDSPSFFISNLMDIWTLKEVIVDKQYETIKKIDGTGTVIDIGAAIGDFTIYAAKKVKKIIAYECDDERVSMMKKNLLLNKISNVVLKHTKVESLRQIMQDIDKCNFFKIDCEGGNTTYLETLKETT